jgi:hypothetical protein
MVAQGDFYVRKLVHTRKIKDHMQIYHEIYCRINRKYWLIDRLVFNANLYGISTISSCHLKGNSNTSRRKRQDWLIDYRLTSNEQYFSYIQDENKFNNRLKKNLTERGKGWVNRVSDFWLPLKLYGELGRDEQIVFCSDCNAPTLFRNPRKISLVCRERGTL